MSLPRKVTVNCSQCGKPLAATVFHSVNTDYAENIAAQIISGRLFDVECSHCGFVSHLEYDTLYHDMKHGAMVWVVHKNNPEYTSKITEIRNTKAPLHKTLRIVEDMNALKEKVSCLEKERDDRIIELCKVFLTANLLAQQPDFKFRNAFYTSITGDEVIYFYDEDGNSLSCNLREDTYEYIKDLYCNSAFPAQFDGNHAIVDYTWAERVLMPLLEAESEKNAVKKAENSNMMICPQCNHELPWDSKFCQYCGTPVSKKPVLQVQEAGTIGSPAKKPATPAAAPVKQPIKTARSKRHIILPIVLGIIALASVVLNAVQHTQCTDLQALVSSQNESLLKKDEEIQVLNEEVQVLNDHIAYRDQYIREKELRISELVSEKADLFNDLQVYKDSFAIVLADSREYHAYDCEGWTLLDWIHFRDGDYSVYKIETAERSGYSACPKCH